jgi:hypothetical protein
MTLFRLAWTLCVTGVVACVMSGGQRVVHAAAPDSIIARLVALPLSDRASLLVELKQPVPLARETKSDAQSVVVEAGPIDGNVEALELTPAGTTPLIGPVAVSAVTTASGQVFLRITVQLRARASHCRYAGHQRLSKPPHVRCTLPDLPWPVPRRHRQEPPGQVRPPRRRPPLPRTQPPPRTRRQR